MPLVDAKHLGLQIYKINIWAQKINGLLLETFQMVITGF